MKKSFHDHDVFGGPPRSRHAVRGHDTGWTEVLQAYVKPYDGSTLNKKISTALTASGKLKDLHMIIWKWTPNPNSYHGDYRLYKLKYMCTAKRLSQKETFVATDPSFKVVVLLKLQEGLSYYVDGKLFRRINHKDLGEKKARKWGVSRWRQGETVEWLLPTPIYGLKRLAVNDADKYLKAWWNRKTPKEQS